MRHRKRVIRSTIEKQLSLEQREKVHGWMRANLTYCQIVKRIYGAWGVKLSEGAVGEYYHRQFFAAELRRKAEERGIQAAGVEIIIRLPEPGRVHVEVRPLED